MDIIITIPSTINWETYQKELDFVKDGKNVLNFKVSNFPKMTNVGDKCYLNYKGSIIGWMNITGLSQKDFTCSTTGKEWKGKFIYILKENHKIFSFMDEFQLFFDFLNNFFILNDFNFQYLIYNI